MKEKITNSIILFAKFCMISAVIILAFAWHDIRQDQCTSDPLKFAAIFYEDNYGYEFVGSGFFIELEGNKQSPVLNFDKSGVTIQKVVGHQRDYGFELNFNSTQFEDLINEE